MKRYEIMRSWTKGFGAGVAMTEGWDDSQTTHWKAGYESGYKMRREKNRLLDEYLVSNGMEPQAKIILMEKN